MEVLQVLEIFRTWGVSVGVGVLILTLVLFVHDPDRAEKLAKLLSKPFFVLFKWLPKFYISRDISLNVSQFLNRDILSVMDNSAALKVKVKLNFVRGKEDLRVMKDGIIIRLREDDDQTRNILAATNLALPYVICRHIRPNLDKNLSKAIDLTVLKKLANKMGRHAEYVYQTNFLDPELLENPTINDLIQQLVVIDGKGLFVSIFANELGYVGEGTFARSDRANRTIEAIDFLRFLLNIAERERNSTNTLDFHSDAINVGLILLAKAERASNEGLTPYIKRLKKNFYSGCESVYVIAYPLAWDFFGNLLSVTAKDKTYNIVNSYKLDEIENTTTQEIKVALIRVNQLFLDRNIATRLSELRIEVGSRIEGVVTDLSTENALVSIAGMNGYISKSECSWYSLSSCGDNLHLHHTYEFIVKDINYSSGHITLTRRFTENDPWKDAPIPEVGTVIEVVPQYPTEYYLNCRMNDDIEVRVPISEIVWGDVSDSDIVNIIGSRMKAVVLLVQQKDRLIRASFRHLPAKSWDEIKERFPVGTSILGSVMSINPQFVAVEISNGIVGRITKESFLAAGHELRDFENNLLIGQKLQVKIQRVWTGREKISLELARNLDGRAEPLLIDDAPEPHAIVKMPVKVKKHAN
jgi:hypothetical protein